jgi:glycosyltransferase involved in cell wall biosynthesis
MNRKSVLILCDLFPPAFGPRMGYLCKYLRLNGWTPVVVTEQVDDGALFSFLANEAEATRLRFHRRRPGLVGRIEWLATFVRDLLFGYKDRRMYRAALAKVEKRRFDLILCSTFRTFPLPAADRLARKTRLPLVVDLRDIIEQYTSQSEFIEHRLPKLFGVRRILSAQFARRNLRIRNRILPRAACVTTVSPWHVARLEPFNSNVRLIYNGYDPELFYPAAQPADRFYITYAGRLHSTAMRNPDLLLQAVDRLAHDCLITPSHFRVRWYVDEKSRRIVEREIRKYPAIAPYMDYMGYVPAAEIPRILNESAILLLLTNRPDADGQGPKGVMTTKFFEFLAVGKPILCVRGDEGCLEAAIRRTRSGLSAHHTEEVYDFIHTHYRRWKENKPFVDRSDREEIRKFSREAQAKQFIQLFEQAIASPPPPKRTKT